MPSTSLQPADVQFSNIIICENWTSAGCELVEGKGESAGWRVEHHAVRPVAPSHKSAARQFADDPVAGLHRHCVASATDWVAGTAWAADGHVPAVPRILSLSHSRTVMLNVSRRRSVDGLPLIWRGRGRLSADRASPFTHRQAGDAISIRLSSQGSLRRSSVSAPATVESFLRPNSQIL